MDHSFSTSTPVDDATDDFYAELTRQILLLTDEDDEIQVKKKGGRRIRFNNHRSVNGGWSLMPGNYFFSWSDSEGGRVEVPVWMERLWAANGGGTGVFIPRCGSTVQHRSSRRRHNKARKSDDKGKAHSAPGQKIYESSYDSYMC